MGSPFRDKASSNQAFEVPPAGAHPAVLVALIDLGTHDRVFQGQQQGEAPQLYLAWELTAEPCAGTNRNHVLGRQFTRSLNKKAKLRQFIESWSGRSLNDGEEFDYEKMLGKRCLLNVVHKQSGEYTNANVDSVGRIPKGMAVPPNKIEPYVWYFGCGKPLPEQPWLPLIYGKTVKQMIETAHESVHGAHLEPAGVASAGDGNGAAYEENQDADEIPF